MSVLAICWILAIHNHRKILQSLSQHDPPPSPTLTLVPVISGHLCRDQAPAPDTLSHVTNSNTFLASVCSLSLQSHVRAINVRVEDNCDKKP